MFFCSKRIQKKTTSPAFLSFSNFGWQNCACFFRILGQIRGQIWRGEMRKVAIFENCFSGRECLRETQHTPGAYPKHPQTPKWKEFLHKLLVGGLGYAPGVCWKGLGEWNEFSSHWNWGNFLEVLGHHFLVRLGTSEFHHYFFVGVYYHHPKGVSPFLNMVVVDSTSRVDIFWNEVGSSTYSEWYHYFGASTWMTASAWYLYAARGAGFFVWDKGCRVTKNTILFS